MMLKCIQQICFEYLPLNEALNIQKKGGYSFNLHSYYKNVNIIRWFEDSNNEKEVLEHLISLEYIEVLRHLSRTNYIFNSNQTTCTIFDRCLYCTSRIHFSEWMDVIRILYLVGVRHFCPSTVQHIAHYGNLKFIDYFMHRELYNKNRIIPRLMHYAKDWSSLKYFIDMGGDDLDTKTYYNIVEMVLEDDRFGNEYGEKINNIHIILYLYTKVHIGKDRMYQCLNRKTVKELKQICRILKLPQRSYLTIKKQFINYILNIGKKYIKKYLETVTYVL